MADAAFSKSEIERASQLKQEELYRKQGYRQARFLGRSPQDYENHLFAFLIDLNICLVPVYLWGIEFLLILAGVIPPSYFDLLFYIMYGCLFLTSCVALPLYTASTGGESWGGKLIGLRLVKTSKRPASAISLVLCQLFGFGVPLMLFGYFFSIFGIIFWWGLNTIVTVASPHQRSIFQLIFGLVLVYTPKIKVKAGKKAQPQPEEPKPESAPVVTQPSLPAKTENISEDAELSRIDLHLRSSYSDDGSYDVEELFRQAKDKGMEVISITDHNNSRANAQAVRFSSLYGIKYIPGVEIDTELYHERVRILGYYIDWNDPVFDEIERLSLKRESDLSMKRIQAFEKACHLKVDIDSLLAKSRFKVLFPKDLTDLVFENEQARQLPAVAPFIEQSSSEEQARARFMEAYFGPGGLCEVKATYPDAQEVIKAIHNAGGMAVLSGWHAGTLSDEVIEGLLDGGLDGLEVFSPDTDEQTRLFLLTLAKQESLFVTEGSDYHGQWRPERKMGLTGSGEKGERLVGIFAGVGKDGSDVQSLI